MKVFASYLKDRSVKVVIAILKEDVPAVIGEDPLLIEELWDSDTTDPGEFRCYAVRQTPLTATEIQSAQTLS